MDKLVVKGAEISVQWNSEQDDFISLTDIAKLKDSDNPRYIIQNWLRNRNTIEFLGVWESLYNPSFNRVEFDAFRSCLLYTSPSPRDSTSSRMPSSA